jgi:hypothetical protein
VVVGLARDARIAIFSALLVPVGVVDDEQLALGSADRELLAVKREVADLGVVDPCRPTLEGPMKDGIVSAR